MKCPSLSELPPPPASKKGWPWTEESEQSPPAEFVGMDFPSITIITPNLNYGHFLEETIRSVVLQGYPNLEYIVLDAGSKDQSLGILEKYAKWISFSVEKDLRQSASINLGLRKAKGEIFNWLNSDDLLMPNALWRIGALFKRFPEFSWLTGARMMIDENSRDLYCELTWPSNLTSTAYGIPNFPQDATFFRRDTLLKLNAIREELENGFDSFLQLTFLRDYPVLLTRCVFSQMRLHRNQKTRQFDKRVQEMQTAILPLISSLPLRSRLCYHLCFGKLGPLFVGLFEEYRQWTKGSLMLNEAWFDLAELQWKLIKR